MCLAVPALLVELNGEEGVADLHGNRLPVNLQLVPDARPGDWLLIHAGFAIGRLDEDEARETFAVLAELQAARRAAAPEQADSARQEAPP